MRRFTCPWIWHRPLQESHLPKQFWVGACWEARSVKPVKAEKSDEMGVTNDLSQC